MIYINIEKNPFPYVLRTKQMALRFMYAMRSKGYFITGWVCDDTLDNEWLNKRFKQ